MRRSLLLVVLVARAAAAQTADTPQRPNGASAIVSGVVHDSIARKALAGAVVQLVSADGQQRAGHTTTADSLGRFALGDVPDGRYMLGFFHPMLDSLGLQAPLRQVQIDQQKPVQADLAIPSPARVRGAICGIRSEVDSSAVVVGVVRRARDGTIVSGVTVRGAWIEFSLSTNGMRRRTEQLVATTGENGWFAMCNVPRGGSMALIASLGTDSTDLIDVQIPAEGFLRRELYLGTVPEENSDISQQPTTRSRGVSRPRRGDGRLRGTIIAAMNSQPVAGAQVSVGDGLQTRSNERGEWTLVNVPSGTRMLEVRAVGFYPARLAVDVVAEGPPLEVTLATFKAVLDTLKVHAKRLYNRDVLGFQQRSRSGVGRFLTQEDIARRRPIVTSDIFKSFVGLRLEIVHQSDTATSISLAQRETEPAVPKSDLDRQILMRTAGGEYCLPAIYLDGDYLGRLTAGELDAWLRPPEIVGVEVYDATSTPAQFQRGMSGCGAIAIWSK